MFNVNPLIHEQILKLRSVSLNSNTTGQLMTDLMVNPPTLETCSQETVDQYNAEKLAIFDSLKRRAILITEALNKMVNISCQPIEGALYAFPTIKFSDKAILEASKRRM